MEEGQKSKTWVGLASCKMFEEMKAKMMNHDGLCFSSSSWPPKLGLCWVSLDPTCKHMYPWWWFPTLFSSTDDGPKPDQNMAMKPLLNIGRSSKWECSGGPNSISVSMNIAKLDGNFRPIGWGRASTSPLVSFKANPIMSIQKRIPKQIQRGNEPGQSFRIVKSRIWGP